MASAQELPSLVPPSYTLTTPVIVQRLAMGLFLVAGTTGVSRAAGGSGTVLASMFTLPGR